MNRLDTAYNTRLLPQSPLTKDNLIRGKDKLKEQVEIPFRIDTRVPFATYAYNLTTSGCSQVVTPAIYTQCLPFGRFLSKYAALGKMALTKQKILDRECAGFLMLLNKQV